MKKKLFAIISFGLASLITASAVAALNISGEDSIMDINTDQVTLEVSSLETVSDVISEETTHEMISEKELAELAWVEENKITLDVIPEFDGSLTVYSAEEALEKIPYQTTFLPKYRDIYYWEPTFLFHLVTREEFRAWYEEVVVPSKENNTEPEEMYTVSFVKHFKISKADFEEACEMRRQRIATLRDKYGHDVSTEGHEIHNADIIYTFDNEIINNYYLRESNSNNIENDIK